MDAASTPDLVLIATTDEDLVGGLRSALETEQLLVTSKKDPEVLFQEVAQRVPRVLLLDARLLPGATPQICRRLRSSQVTSNVTIIVLTAPESVTERIRALESGADDCVVTPIHMGELVARIRTRPRHGELPSPLGHLRAGPIDMDLDRWTTHVEDQAVTLTNKEFQLLKVLIESRGRTLTRRYLLEAVWSLRTPIETRTVDVHIARLRRKLGSAGRYIVTVRNVGFRFDLVSDWLAGRPSPAN